MIHAMGANWSRCQVRGPPARGQHPLCLIEGWLAGTGSPRIEDKLTGQQGGERLE
jgi:hypothetical protein